MMHANPHMQYLAPGSRYARPTLHAMRLRTR